MMSAPERQVQLSRMEAARRQTQHQLFIIDRQITRRMNMLIPQLRRKRSPFHHGKASDPRSFVERYRSNLAALTAERQSEIDALASKLARQDAAIAVLRAKFASGSSRAA
jgi:hypothetical protein